MTSFSIIVAVDSKSGIGKDGGLPWRFSADMRHFKSVTSRPHACGHPNAVVMGRKTWESLPDAFRPLPGRLNVVITRQTDYALAPGVLKAGDLEHALAALGRMRDKVGEIFVIGGGQVFGDALKDPGCRRIYLTQIDHDYRCDTFFPDPSQNFRPVGQAHTHSENGVVLSFLELERVTP